MRRSLCLALACLLLAHGALAGPNSQGGRIRKLLATASPVVPSTAGVKTKVSLGHGGSVVCDVWIEGMKDWGTPTGGTKYVAKGKTVPPAADVKKVESQICSNPKSAAQQLTNAIQAGGAQVQLWVYSLFDADCSDPSADTLEYNIAANSADPSDLAATKAYFTSFAKAADAVGIPICVSVALVDDATGKVLEQSTYHTGS